MNKRMILASFVAGASMLTLAGSVSAATTDLNIYGASAQFLYWNAVAPNVLTNMGCTNIEQAKLGSNQGITRATCGADTVYYRVAAKASFDGPSAVMGDDHYADTAEKCVSTSVGYPGAALAPYYRLMIDEASCTTWGPTTAPGSCGATKCARITLGASDVAAESFTQSSSGQLKGPLGGGVISRTFTGIDVTGLTSYQPLVVPFAFFSHNTVQKDTAYPAGAFSTISNMPRSMAVQLFSGQVYNWKDFGDEFVSLDAVACLRHAGSGTASAFDHTIMNGGFWGAPVASVESVGGPTIYFNDSSSDLMKCVNTVAGAVGYADADQTTSAYPNVVRLSYNGEVPSRVNMRNGRYEYFTNMWMYEDPAAPNYAVTHPIVSAMMAFAADPASIPTTSTAWGSAKSDYWATRAEMVFNKVNDKGYPGYVGAASPQLP